MQWLKDRGKPTLSVMGMAAAEAKAHTRRAVRGRQAEGRRGGRRHRLREEDTFILYFLAPPSLRNRT